MTVNGTARVGGLVGYADVSVSVFDSYSTGTVTGTANVGGLVGYAYSYCYINNSYTTGAVTGDSNVGGLAGTVSSNVHLNYNYATGTVSGTSEVGGMVGTYDSNSTVQNCFYDKETTGYSGPTGWTEAGTAVSTENMKNATTFTGASWDFNNIWSIGTLNSGYPYLTDNAPKE